MRFKDGTWRLIEVDKGEVTTLSCEEKNKFVEIIAEGIAPLISENVTSLRLMQEELLSAYSKLQGDFEETEVVLAAALARASMLEDQIAALQRQRSQLEIRERNLSQTLAQQADAIKRLQTALVNSEKSRAESQDNQSSAFELAKTLQAQLSAALAAAAQAENKLAAKLAAETDLDQLAALKQAIIALQKKDAESQEQLRNLGNRLNAALARAASEQRRRLKLEEAERQRLEAETPSTD